jgi:hypothetical protein
VDIPIFKHCRFWICGYTIRNRISKAKGYDRSALLSPLNQENKQEIIPFVHTHNPRNQNLTSLIHQLNNILRQDESTEKIFQNVKFINSERQPKSFKRILCKSNFNDSNFYTVAKCRDSRCTTCQYITEGYTYSFNGKLFLKLMQIHVGCAVPGTFCML